MNVRDVLAIVATGALFAVMCVSFFGVAWPNTPTAIPVVDPNATSDNGIADQMFGPFAVTVILSALLLGAAMIGGVYLAKMDEAGKVGP